MIYLYSFLFPQDSSEEEVDEVLSTKLLIPVGFSELTFIDFTSHKFSLIARAFCERNPRRASNIFHNYTCLDCDRAFPCPSALAVHRSSHLVSNSVSCETCRCWFSDPEQYRSHQLTHMKEKVNTFFTQVE